MEHFKIIKGWRSALYEEFFLSRSQKNAWNLNWRQNFQTQFWGAVQPDFFLNFAASWPPWSIQHFKMKKVWGIAFYKERFPIKSRFYVNYVIVKIEFWFFFCWRNLLILFFGHSTVDGNPVKKISAILAHKNIFNHFLQKTRAERDNFSQKSTRFWW